MVGRFGRNKLKAHKLDGLLSDQDLEDALKHLNIHPFAARFPILSREDLADLAADIKRNGLRHPIVRDANEQLLEGRMRMLACQMAGVEPQFERYDGDPIAFIWSCNAVRRQMTKGQLAMLAALAYPEPEGRGRGKKSSAAEHFPMVSSGKLSEARTILRHAADLADQVVSGMKSLESVYDTACERKQKTEEAEHRMNQLRAEAPDLANLVAEQKITLDEAWEDFQRHLDGDQEGDLRKILRLLFRHIGGRVSPQEAAQHVVANFEFDGEDDWDEDEEGWQPKDFKKCAAVFAALADLAADYQQQQLRVRGPLGRRELGSTLDILRRVKGRRWLDDDENDVEPGPLGQQEEEEKLEKDDIAPKGENDGEDQ